MAAPLVIDEHNVQANTQNYEHALRWALAYLLSRTIVDNDLYRNLEAIREHLITPTPGLMSKDWLHHWTEELYRTWSNETYDQLQNEARDMVSAIALRP
jgi:hypothetical protein